MEYNEKPGTLSGRCCFNHPPRHRVLDQQPHCRRVLSPLPSLTSSLGLTSRETEQNLCCEVSANGGDGLVQYRTPPITAPGSLCLDLNSAVDGPQSSIIGFLWEGGGGFSPRELRCVPVSALVGFRESPPPVLV